VSDRTIGARTRRRRGCVCFAHLPDDKGRGWV